MTRKERADLAHHAHHAHHSHLARPAPASMLRLDYYVVEQHIAQRESRIISRIAAWADSE